MSRRLPLSKERLIARRHIDENGCWLWTGSRIADGYGMIGVADRSNQLVHRLAAELWLGYVPERGKYVLHRCDQPACFNPDHLFIGNQSDNMKDMFAKGRASRVGSKHPRAQFDESVVGEIKRFLGWGFPPSFLAPGYGVSVGTIQSIARGKTWKHVQP